MEGLLLWLICIFVAPWAVIIGIIIYVEIYYVDWRAFSVCFPRILSVRSMADMDRYVDVMATVFATMLRERIVGTWKALFEIYDIIIVVSKCVLLWMVLSVCTSYITDCIGVSLK
jgi:hypothetical protein